MCVWLLCTIQWYRVHCDWNDAVVVSSDSDEEFKDFKVVSNPQVGSVCSGAMSLQSVQYIPIKAQAQ